MAGSEQPGSTFTLRRWSQRKLAAARTAEPEAARAVPAAPVPAPPPATPAASVAAATLPAPPVDLPAVESLSFDSDFSPFLQPKVDEQLRRQALKKLFSDPRFNVMDGLDVYIDDYGKPDPIAPELVRQLVQGRYLFDPPQTRVNAQGVVEDVPPEEDAAVPPPAAPALPEVPHDTPAAFPSTASDAAAAAEGSAAAQPSPPADRLP